MVPPAKGREGGGRGNVGDGFHGDMVGSSLDVEDDTAEKQFEQLENLINIVRN